MTRKKAKIREQKDIAHEQSFQIVQKSTIFHIDVRLNFKYWHENNKEYSSEISNTNIF